MSRRLRSAATRRGDVIAEQPHLSRPSLLAALVYFVPSYGGAVVGYLLLSIVTARLLGADGFGHYVLATTATGLVGQFALMGVHRAGLRETARTTDPEVRAGIRRGATAVLAVPLPLASVVTGAAVAVWLRPGAGAVAAGLSAALLTYGSGLQVLTANFLRGLGRVKAAGLLTGRSGGALVAAAQTLGVLAVNLVVAEPSLPAVLAGTALGFVPPMVWAMWLLHRSLPRRRGSHGLVGELKIVLARDWRFASSQAGAFLSSSMELWIAGAVLPATGTSNFAAAERLGRLLMIPSTALQTVFSPAVARLVGTGDVGRLERLLRTAASAATLAAGALWVPMVLAPGFVLVLVFGEGFSTAAAALVVISTHYVLNAVSGMAGTALSMGHQEGWVARFMWISVVLRLVSGVVCARFWGTTGLAASALVIASLYYLATWLAARRLLDVSTHATLRPHWRLLRKVSA